MSPDSGETDGAPRTSGTPAWVGAAVLIAGVTVVARLIGFVRYLVLARTVGTTCLGDVYATANAVPNIVYELVVGGALVAVVVPLVAGARESDPGKVRATVAALHGWALLLLVPVTAVMYLGSGIVIDVLLGPGGDCGGTAASDVAVEMLWVFLLQIPVYGATVVAQGALQSHHRFLAPAVAPAVSSLVVIGSYLAYAAAAGDQRGSLEDLSRQEFWLLAGGTTAGVVTLLLAQVPALQRAGLVVWPSLTFPAGRARQAMTLAWSGAVVVGSQWVAYALAIRWSNVYGSEGSALVFVLAWTLFLLPWAVLALPVATSTFPRLSALAAQGDADGGARLAAQSLRSIVVVSTVGAAGVAAGATPLAALMVEGAPGGGTDELAAALLGLSVGVLAYGVHGHLVRVLAARGRASVAAVATAAGWVVGIAAAGALVRRAEGAVEVMGGIGVGFSIGLVTGAAILTVALVKDAGPAAVDEVGRTLLAAVSAGLVAVVALRTWLPSDPEGAGAAVVQLVVVGVGVVAAVAAATAVAEPGLLRSLPGALRSGRHPEDVP
jgi:putative peptidoglycan lipid II flippase